MVTISRLQIAYVAGLVGFVCVAVLGQAELIGEPWHHWISIAGIVGTAVSGYLIQPPRDPQAQTRADDPPSQEKQAS